MRCREALVARVVLPCRTPHTLGTEGHADENTVVELVVTTDRHPAH